MSYHQDCQYTQGCHPGYPPSAVSRPRYDPTAAAQYQHPQVVISRQPQHHGPPLGPSPAAYSNASQSSYYQNTSTQYYSVPEYQQYNSRPVQQQYDFQGYQQQVAQYLQQQTHQQPYQASRSQPVYSQPVHCQTQHVQPVQRQSSQPYPHLNYHTAPEQRKQLAPTTSSHVPSSPDQLQGPRNVHTMNGQQRKPSQQDKVPEAKPKQRQSSQQSALPISKPQQKSARPVAPMNHTTSSSLQPQQRVLSAVEIPKYVPEVARSPKRRRSNDGDTIEVHHVPTPSAKSSQKKEQKPAAPVSSSPLTDLRSSQFPPTPQPEIDYQATLLSLADEYLSAAYGMSTAIATGKTPASQEDEYCALVSAAMACLESVLTNYRQSDARQEARIRLRLASLMIDECDNDEQVEAILGKGIALCDRNRLLDLKYAMQHLSVRSTFRKSPKAGLKAIDKLVHEVETLRLDHWVYTFRLLRVCLGLQLGAQSETAATLKHLSSLSTTADDQRQIGVQIVAATLEVIVHIRSGSIEAMDSATRAMAAARTHQLGSEMQAMPQIRALLDCLDISCSLVSSKHDAAAGKMYRLQQLLDDGSLEKGWTKDGSFVLNLCPCKNPDIDRDSGGIMRKTANGHAALAVTWITKSQLYALAFALSAFTALQKSQVDGKVDSFAREGLKMAKTTPDPGRKPLSIVLAQAEQHQSLGVAIRFYWAWTLCARSEWENARQVIDRIRSEAKQVEHDDYMSRAIAYMEGLCYQGLGDLQAAVRTYRSPDLAFTPGSKAIAAEKDLRALATLNSIMILRSLGSTERGRAENLLSEVEQYCLKHTNKAIVAAFHIIRATAQDSIVRTKQYLHLATTASKEAANNLLMTIVMNIMTRKFFSETIVGDQAEKSAFAARTLAKSGRNYLWTAVADGMFYEIKERCGRVEEAEQGLEEGAGALGRLPVVLRERLRLTQGGGADGA